MTLTPYQQYPVNLNVHNVNQGLAEGLRHLQNHGILDDSRNGSVLVSPHPVTTTYQEPWNRVLLSPMRDANPFFHLMEALWMLAGRNDLAWPRMFNRNFKNYSDDGVTIHGAYGHRWRKHYMKDQLWPLILELTKPGTRRAVLAMWDPDVDLNRDGKDFPCNTNAFFDTRGGRLNMMINCRSNDIWWGAYGANAVHFSILQEFVAGMLHLPMGLYYQNSFNFHLYPAIVPHQVDRKGKLLFDELIDNAMRSDPYTYETNEHTKARAPVGHVAHRVPLVFPQGEATWAIFHRELHLFMEDAAANHNYPFFRHVAGPMYRAWACYKLGEYGEAEDNILAMTGCGDWSAACMAWLDRRKAKRLLKQADEEQADG